MNQYSTLIIPAVIFTVGCIMIYLLKKYYLNRVTDQWSAENENKKNEIEFEFNSTQAFTVNAILALAITVSILIFSDCKGDRDAEQLYRKEALEQYRKELKREVKQEYYYELTKDIKRERYKELKSDSGNSGSD